MIVLHKSYFSIDCLIKLSLVETFEKEAAIVTKYGWLDTHNVGNRQSGKLHHKIASFNSLIKYWP